jgi:hypothetical protein
MFDDFVFDNFEFGNLGLDIATYVEPVTLFFRRYCWPVRWFRSTIT